MAVSPPQTPAVRVADAVNAAMDARGVTRLELSDATGIPRSTLIRRLNGLLPSFTIDELDRIAQHLEVDVVTLVAPVDAVSA